MVFSDTSTSLGLIQDVTFLLGGVNTTDYATADRTRNINEHYRQIWHDIFEAYGGWRWDDTNQTDLPQATDSLVSGTATYALPSAALTIHAIEVKNSNGDWVKLDPAPAEYINRTTAIDEFLSSNGTPAYYRLLGDTIELFPAPNYASTNGLKVYFDRDISAFAATDTTKVAGFASPYHRVLSIGAALDYALANGMTDKISILSSMYNEYRVNIRKFYSERWRDNQPMRIKVADVTQEYE